MKTNIQSIMDKHIPSKIFKKRNIVPWFNRALKKMTKRKARLYSHAKKLYNGPNINSIKSYANGSLKKPK